MYLLYTYTSLQFLAKMNTSGGKTAKKKNPFHTNDDQIIDYLHNTIA